MSTDWNGAARSALSAVRRARSAQRSDFALAPPRPEEPDMPDHETESAPTLRDRIAELEAENERLRADLDAATHFLIGGYWVARKRYRSDWQVWPNPALVAVTEIPEPETYASRDAAIARARQIAVEGE